MSKIPFPQANNLDKVFTLITLIDTEKFSKVNLSQLMEIHSRQIDYYLNAARFLELLEVDKSKRVTFTLNGHMLRSLNFPKNYIFFANHILNFSKLKPLFLLEKEVDILAELKNLGISKSTINRRLSTLKKWRKWATSVIDKFYK